MTDTITKAKEFLAAISCQDSQSGACDWCGYTRYILPSGNPGGIKITEHNVNNETYSLCNTCIKHTRTRLDVLNDKILSKYGEYKCKYKCNAGGYGECEHTFANHCMVDLVHLDAQDDKEYWNVVDDVELCEALTNALARSINHKEKRDKKSTN